MNDAPQLILASASPRRRELLGQIGIRFQVCPADIDETVNPGETPDEYVSRLALAKARAIQEKLAHSSEATLPILGSDTSVIIDDKILGKPQNQADGLSMLAMLSGREHEVFSAVALIQNQRQLVRVNRSQVSLRPLTKQECMAYWKTGEPADKAGGYAVQGLGAGFVSEIRGSHSGIMGLPLYETTAMLSAFNINIF